MAKPRQQPVKNPFTGESKTRGEWAEELGYKSKNGFSNKYRRLGPDNPETWMTADDGRRLRAERCKKKRTPQTGSRHNGKWEGLKGGSSMDADFKPGTWEARNLGHLGR
jgi:hypothetical protein